MAPVKDTTNLNKGISSKKERLQSDGLMPQKSSHKRFVTPGKSGFTSADPKMVVEKEIVDELLLVCGVIGTTTGEADELVPVTDCLNWLQDLQRALRRDDDSFRPISLLIGKWKVVEQKLLPLVLTCRYDNAIVLTVVKILVILTKPLADATKTAGKLIIDTSGRADPALLRHQMQLRENALEQARLLVEYKRIIVDHASHHSEKQGTGLLSIFVSLLAEPLSRSGASRTEADHLTIELVLHLFRNLLAAEPILNATSDSSRQTTELHQELIALFEKELVLEIFLVLGQDIEARENAQYNLLMMELLHHLLKAQDPTAAARASHPSSSSSSRKTTAILTAKMKGEQSQKKAIANARHGHFGGTWVKQKSDGKTSFFTATNQSTSKDVSVSAKRKNRKSEPFIGSGRGLLAHSQRAYAESGPATQRANASLNAFCKRFIEDCYGPLMKSLKNEFRRDSHRLETGDKVVFFRIIWFFCQWWRMSSQDRKLGQLIFTMDVFTFNLVLSSTDTYYQRKNYTRLAQAVALYSEMMHLLTEMRRSKDETESIMARGLLDRLFYAAEPIDRIPKLLGRWVPGVATREYLCDLVELCHTALKLLEINHSENSASQGNKQNKEDGDKLLKMRSNAAQFDVQDYFCKKIMSNQLVSMYTHLLSQYKMNSATVNHRVLSMFLRIMNTEIISSEPPSNGRPKELLPIERTTLEPLLYNIHLFVVVQTILCDETIDTKDAGKKELVRFSSTLCHRFIAATKKNPMLFIECLFRHSAPARFCELVSNHYVGEELRMLAEREVLLQEHLELMAEHDNIAAHTLNDDDDENEFDDEAALSTELSSHRSTSDDINNKLLSHRGSTIELDAEAETVPSEEIAPGEPSARDRDGSEEGSREDLSSSPSRFGKREFEFEDNDTPKRVKTNEEDLPTELCGTE